MSKTPIPSSDENSEATTANPKLNQPPGSDDDDDEDSDSLPLMPKPKSYANIVKDEDEDDSDDDTETEVLKVEPKVEAEQSDSSDDSEDSAPAVNRIRKHTKWSESDDDDSDTEPVENIPVKKKNILDDDDDEDETDTEIIENVFNEIENLDMPVPCENNDQNGSILPEQNEDFSQQQDENASHSKERIRDALQNQTEIRHTSSSVSELVQDATPQIDDLPQDDGDTTDDCFSNPGSVSPSSLAELLEERIKDWYNEDGLKRPRRQPKEIYDHILQQGIDISDFCLTEEERQILHDEIDNMQHLTLDDLLYRVNTDE